MYTLREINDDDSTWLQEFIVRHWGDESVVAHGRIFHPAQLPGFVVEDHRGGKRGLLTYNIDNNECEVVTINSTVERKGIGTMLMDAVIETARKLGCRRLWLITTNDNTSALRFYQRRGMDIAAIHRNALERSRQLKPSIPLESRDGIPLRHELEVDFQLTDGN
ncbi:MAG: GNAT family N-acetyltransferase [Pseudomonadales bacterium]|nr:GNAT family N-acetyltransferase [Pseudomonadales bacterium]